MAAPILGQLWELARTFIVASFSDSTGHAEAAPSRHAGRYWACTAVILLAGLAVLLAVGLTR
jgi:hypothetical protein